MEEELQESQPGYGFKKLTVDNWLARDEVLSYFVQLTPDGVKPTPNEKWVALVLEPKLRETVPLRVRRLFEVARGAMAYGVFFYPLFALAEEQLYRVAEAAAKEKCKALGIRCDHKPFKWVVNRLAEREVIPEEERSMWDLLRKLRNNASHPSDQAIQVPGSAVGMLWRMIEVINGLFEGDTQRDNSNGGEHRST